MQSTLEALEAWDREPDGFLSVKVDDVEITLEPLLWDKQWYLGIYKNQSLVVPKVVIKIGKEKKDEKNI